MLNDLLAQLTCIDDNVQPRTYAVPSIREACEVLADTGHDVEADWTDRDRALVRVGNHRVRLVTDCRCLVAQSTM